MEKKSRRRFSADFKAKVVIEALKEHNTIEQLAKKYDLHPNEITSWKKEFLSNASLAFSGSGERPAVEKDAEVDKLVAQIGQLTVENAYLKKNCCKECGREKSHDRTGNKVEYSSTMYIAVSVQE